MRFVRFFAAGLLLIWLVPVSFAERTEKAKSIGKRMMCLCGCNQILTECNHVGCTVSAEMLKKLDQQAARNEPEDLTIQAFVQEYGQRVLAQPPSSGFGVVAWLTPVVASLLGLWIVWVVLRHWSRPPRVSEAGPPVPAELLERARREAAQETED